MSDKPNAPQPRHGDPNDPTRREPVKESETSHGAGRTDQNQLDRESETLPNPTKRDK